MRPAELEQAHMERVRRVSITAGTVMFTLGIIIGYTAGYVIWRAL